MAICYDLTVVNRKESGKTSKKLDKQTLIHSTSLHSRR
nr:MAG TPA: hypothetical protein [Caudoviricetes sp.]DAT49826.1 MAG TPA: hypothetical protein [Bacteriophage sp.]